MKMADMKKAARTELSPALFLGLSFMLLFLVFMFVDSPWTNKTGLE